MGKEPPKRRFVANAEAGRGWRIRDKMQGKPWGPYLAEQPDELLAELNGQKRPERIEELLRIAQSPSRRIFAERQ